MGKVQSKIQGRYKHFSNEKDAKPHPSPRSPTPERLSPAQSMTANDPFLDNQPRVASRRRAPLARFDEDDDIVAVSPSPSLFSMTPFDDVIRRLTSGQGQDKPDDLDDVGNVDDYDDASIATDIFDEDMISLSWSASFHSQHDLDAQSTDTGIVTDIMTDVDDDDASSCQESVSEIEIEIEGEKAEQRVPEMKKKRKRRSAVKSVRKFLRRRAERRERKKPRGWVWWTPEGTLCVVDENGDFYHEHHVVDKMRFRRGRSGPETLRYWVSQDCQCSD